LRRPVLEHLAARPDTHSIFAFTAVGNEAERRALLNAGFREEGPLPDSRYPVPLPRDPCLLFVWPTPDPAAPTDRAT